VDGDVAIIDAIFTGDATCMPHGHPSCYGNEELVVA
jgi:hypothetical protein